MGSPSQRDIERLQQQVNTLKLRNMQLEHDHAKFENFSAEQNSLQAQLLTSRMSVIDLESQNSWQAAEIRGYEKLTNGHQNKIAELHTKIHTLQDEIRALTSSNETLREQNRTYNETYIFPEQREQMEAARMQAEDKIRMLEAEIERLKKEHAHELELQKKAAQKSLPPLGIANGLKPRLS